MKYLKNFCTVIVFCLFLTGCAEAKEENIYSGFIEGSYYAAAAEFGGEVLSVEVSESEWVSKNHLLVDLDDSELQSALLQAQEGLMAAEAVLAGLADKPTQAEVDAAEAALDTAEAQKEQMLQYEALLEKKAVTSAEFAALFGTSNPDDALETADAAIRLAEAVLENVKAGVPAAEVQAAESAVKQAEILLSILETQIRRVDVFAPKSGIITQVLTNPGAAAGPGQVLVQVMDPEDISITIYVPAASLPSFAMGAEVGVMVDSYPEEEFTGKIVFIADEAQFTPSNVQTREERVKLVFAVKIQLLDGLDKIKPGIPADVIFE